MNFENITSNKKLLTTIGIIILIPLFILLIINFTPSHRNIQELNKICKSIKSCNMSLKDAIDDKTIDSEIAEEKLSSEGIKLNNHKSELESLEVADKNNVLKEHLLETLSYNINLYNLSLNLIRNPKDLDIPLKYDEYSKTYELILKSYENLRLLGLKAEFPQSAKVFFENSATFIGTVINLNKENGIKESQKKSYVSNIKNCIEDFEKINEDLKPALDKIKEDGRSLDVLLKDIKEKKSIFSDIKSKSYNLTIPEEGNNSYELLKETLNYYDLYITSLEHSILIEESIENKDNKDLKNIEKSYKNSFSKFEDFNKSYKSLIDEVNNLNEN